MKPQHIPNALCVFRILLVGPIVWLLAQGSYAAAMLMFAAAGFTDGLDGFLARRFDWRTRLGGFLDPAADKLLMVSVFVTLVALGLIPMWLGVVVVARDAVIVTGVAAYRFLFGPFEGAASPVSKINTAVQLLFVLAVIGRAAFGVPAEPVVVVLGALLLATTVISGLDYVRTGTVAALKSRRETRHGT